MEALNRLVTDSLVRHGFDRPVDPRRLQWSRWFACDSTRSLLVVPSKPGIFAIAEEIMDLSPTHAHIGTDAFVRPSTEASPHVGTAAPGCPTASTESSLNHNMNWEAPDVSRAINSSSSKPASAVEPRRMLAVLQFSEDDDMAFTLDRMFTRINPMRDRLSSGRCFLRFVVIEDQQQRRSICSALNQWMLSSAEKATGIPAPFSSSLEMASVARTPSSATADGCTDRVGRTLLSAAPDAIRQPLQTSPLGPINFTDSGADANLHCPHSLPSGF